MLTEGAKTYSYDVNGNRNMAGYVTVNGNRIQTDGVNTFAYDGAGQMISKIDAAGAKWTYTYDHAGHMTSAQLKSASNVIVNTVNFTFDVFGNRLSRVETGATRSTARYVYDGGNRERPRAKGTENFDVILDLSSTNAVTARRMYADSFDEPIVRRVGSTINWYAVDRQGSVRRILNNSGASIASSDFDGYGNLTAGALTDRVGYTAREWDSTLGLWYYRDRWYAAYIGRFLKVDSMGFAAGDMNLSRYVGNGPVNGADSSGMEDEKRLASQELDFAYPLNPNNDIVLSTVVTITSVNKKLKLELRIVEGDKFREYIGLYDSKDAFERIMMGTRAASDLDSAQVAVRFSGSKYVISHFSSATPQFETINNQTFPRKKVVVTNALTSTINEPASLWSDRKKGEKPRAGVGKGARHVYGELEIPADATEINVVFIFTDILYQTNAFGRIEPENGKGTTTYGDLPAVMGSYTATLDEQGKWTIKVNKNDTTVFDGNPKNVIKSEGLSIVPVHVGSLEGRVNKVAGVLESRTGYSLLSRPTTTRNLYPTSKENIKKIRELVKEAEDTKEIRSDLDTGYDIDTRPTTVGPLLPH